jgi:hypothetical protein
MPMTLTLKVTDSDGKVLAASAGDDEVILVYRSEYQAGDVITVETSSSHRFLELCLDNSMRPALVLLTGSTYRFPVPFGAQATVYPPQAFSGNMHRLSVRLARRDEISNRRNLALNPYDTPDNHQIFPHAFANVSTRDEAAFFARNAIDGERAATGHGLWPYTSWGINRDPNATLTIEFGRPVMIDAVVLYLRADFPHDAWWQQASLSFDSAQTRTVTLEKTHKGQHFTFDPLYTERVKFHALIKADDPSPYPALSQIECWGYEREHPLK